MPKKKQSPMSQMDYWDIASTALNRILPVYMWEGVQDWDLLDDEIQMFCDNYPWLDA